MNLGCFGICILVFRPCSNLKIAFVFVVLMLSLLSLKVLNQIQQSHEVFT